MGVLKPILLVFFLSILVLYTVESSTYAGGDEISTSLVVQGDAWKVSTSPNPLELSENLRIGKNMESFADITSRSYIGDEELPCTLTDGVASNTNGDSNYEQRLYFEDTSTGYVKFMENSHGETADFLHFVAGKQIARYELEFETYLESVIYDKYGTASSTGDYLIDFEGVPLMILGKQVFIDRATRNRGNNNQIKLILMTGSVGDSLHEGETKTYVIDEKYYQVTLDSVSSTQVRFSINGEYTEFLIEGSSDNVAQGLNVDVIEIVYQDYEEGIKGCYFIIGLDKYELIDTNIQDEESSNQLIVDNEIIKGSKVWIEGSDDSNTFKLEKIVVNMTAQDNYYIPFNGDLSDNLNQPDLLLMRLWDIRSYGLSSGISEDIKITPIGSDDYQLEFIDGNGEIAILPLIHVIVSSTIKFGTEDYNTIIIENKSINLKDYFIVVDETKDDGKRNSYALRYVGSDNATSDNPQIQIKDLGSGITIVRPFSPSTTPLSGVVGPHGGKLYEIGVMKLGGATFRIYNVSSTKSDDYQIIVDLDASGTITSEKAILNTRYGAKIDITNSTEVTVSISTPHKDDYDDLIPTPFVFEITGLDGEARLNKSDQDYYNWLSIPNEENTEYAYSSMGAKAKYYSPPNDPQTLSVKYPEEQLETLVYVHTESSCSIEVKCSSPKEEICDNIDNDCDNIVDENLTRPCSNECISGIEICFQGEWIDSINFLHPPFNFSTIGSTIRKFLQETESFNLVVGDTASAEDVISIVDILLSFEAYCSNNVICNNPELNAVKLTSEIENLSNTNLISVGRPSNNYISNHYLNNSLWPLIENTAVIARFVHNNKATIVIAGNTDRDTRIASKIIANYWNFTLNHTCFIVNTTNLHLTKCDHKFSDSKHCTIPTDGMVILENTTFCSGEYYLPNGIIINSDNVKVECNDTKIQGEDLQRSSGIFINSSNNIIINNCTIIDFDSGIRAEHINHLKVSNIHLLNNHINSTHGIGIYSEGLTNSIISSNIFTEMDDAISIGLKTENNLIYNNNITAGNYGIDLDSEASNNFVFNNSIIGGNGIFVGGSNNSIFDNIISVLDIGINPYSSGENKIFSNDISSGSLGIAVRESYEISNEIYNNNITFKFDPSSETQGLHGIPTGIGFDTGVRGHIVSNNIIKNFPQGIDMYDESQYNIISNNTIINSTIRGIRCEFECIGNIITNNNIQRGHIGILLESDTHDNILSYNTISNVDVGINITAYRDDLTPYNNSLIDNNIYNSTIGIYIGKYYIEDFFSIRSSNFRRSGSIKTEEIQENSISNNKICSNNLDILSSELNTSYSGLNNICDETINWNDIGALGCSQVCIFQLSVHSPVLTFSNKRRIPINLTTNMITDKISYIDYSQNRPRERTLCRNCDEYGNTRTKSLSFRDGFHNLSFLARKDNEVVNESISLFVDTKKPRIYRQFPRNRRVLGKKANFTVIYTELNLNKIYLHYQIGQDNFTTVPLENCTSGIRKECSIEIEFNDSNDGKNFEYFFTVMDELSKVNSRHYKLTLATKPPVLDIHSPQPIFYDSRRIPLELNLNKKAKIDYSLDGNNYRKFCSFCERINRKLYVRNNGDHNLTIRAIDKAGNEVNETVFFNN